MASFIDRAGNHIEMGLHVFFGCYFNLFRLMRKTGAVQNLLLKEHTHTFVNTDGDVRELDFRFDVNGLKIGAPFHGARAPPLKHSFAPGCCWLLLPFCYVQSLGPSGRLCEAVLLALGMGPGRLGL